MNILFVSSALPAPWHPHTSRMFYASKYLFEKYGHDITFITVRKETDRNSPWVTELRRYCSSFEIIDLPISSLPSTLKRSMYVLRKMLSPQNIFSKSPSFSYHLYSPKMKKAVSDILSSKRIDIIFADGYLIPFFYLMGTSVKKILEVENTSMEFWGRYKLETKAWAKFMNLLLYFEARAKERQFKKFDTFLVKTHHDKRMLDTVAPDASVSIIPYGVDTDYFKPIDVKQDFPSLIFTGNLYNQSNKQAILHFYNKVYPLVKQKEPRLILQIVGDSPGNEILKLSQDKSVSVTGFVEDIRPYLAKSTIVVVPAVVKTGGIKTKILEAMAMGKLIVCTSIAAYGIDVTTGENVMIADKPSCFANAILEALENAELRQKIGANARKLVGVSYSWEKLTSALNELFEETITIGGQL